MAISQDLQGRQLFEDLVLKIIGKTGQQRVSGGKDQELGEGIITLSDAKDDEATAASGVLISKIQSTVLTFCPTGVCMIADSSDLSFAEVIPRWPCSADAPWRA